MKYPKYTIVLICPISTKGYSTWFCPINPNKINTTINQKKDIFLKILKIFLCSSSKFKINKTNKLKSIPKTPKSLLGIDLNIA